MSCDKTLQVMAYCDGELDSIAAAAVEEHLHACAECAALRTSLMQVNEKIAEQGNYYRASPALRARIGRYADAPQSRWRQRWERVTGLPYARFLGGALAGAVLATLVLLVFLLPGTNGMAGAVVEAHLRSLAANRLVDVASDDRHAIKPWFGGRVDVAPAVADFGDRGFNLIGGRVDYVNGTRAAVLVYRHNRHVVDIFVWKDDGRNAPGKKIRNGYNLFAWKSGDLFYCAVSDADATEIEGLSRLIRGTT